MAWLKNILFSFIVLVLSGCADDVEESASLATVDAVKAPQKVVDAFSTGGQVVVRSLAIEGKERLWVGTSHGVMEIDLANQAVVNTFTRADGLANEYVFAIGIDSLGYKWFGTNAGGVSRYRDGEWTTLFPLHGLADYWIYAFAEQSPRDFWIGTWAGVNRLDLNTLQMKTYMDELINEWVYGIGVDRKNRVWFGTEGGVTMYDGTDWRHWTHEDGLGVPNKNNLPHSQNTGLGTRSRHDLNVSVDGGESYNPNYIFSVLVDDKDEVWFGTWGAGVARFNGKVWKNYGKEEGLAGNIVYSLAQDQEGVFWFGTNQGLTRYDGNSWHTYTSEDGLLGNDVYAIAIAENGDIWAGTQGGVVFLRYE